MAEFVDHSHVFVDDESKNTEQALKFLAKKAVELGLSDDEQAVYEAFAARENEGTTGMVRGVAIPHAKSDVIKEPGVLVVKYTNDVEWDSMDQAPIKLAIALLIPNSQAGEAHLKNLSKIAVMLMKEGGCEDLIAAEDSKVLAQLINDSIED